MTDRKPHLDSLAVTLLVGCCFLWGLNQVAAKAALPEVPALHQAAVRSAGGALLVWLWALARGIRLFDRDGTLPGGLLAGALFALEFGCIFVGLQFTTASRMVVFIYLAPFVVALGMPFIARSERLSATQLAGLVAAFAGVAWAFAEGFTQPAAGERQWLGDALGVAAGVLWGATTLAIRAAGSPPPRPRRRCCTSWRCRACCFPWPRRSAARRCPAAFRCSRGRHWASRW
jgi:drug/metabolite transporter (DMT)-like permease